MADPTNPATPANSDKAKFGAEELRALKLYIQGLMAGSLGQGPSARQCAQYGSVDSTGDPNAVSIGAGLNVDLAATATPLLLSYAAGEGLSGPVNYGEIISVDAAGFVTCLPSNTNYISKLYGGAWDKTLALPQYGKIYDRSTQAVLQFGGVAGSVVFLDDFGNTWIPTNNGRVQTNQLKFGSGALGGGAALNTFNGSSDGVRCNGITSLNKQGGSWSMRTWCYWTTLPTVGEFRTVFNFGQGATRFGAYLGMTNTAGTIRWAYSLSSDSTTDNIALSTVGTSLPVINTWYFVELTYDALAGTYRMYINGTQEASTASVQKVSSGAAISIGTRNDGVAAAGMLGYADKFEFLPYCDHPAGTAYVVPTSAPSVASVNYASDFFDTQQMKMFKITGASVAAATNPAMTNINKIYVAEADTTGAAVSAVRNYAYKARYEAAPITITNAAATLQSANHYIGVPQVSVKTDLVCLLSEGGYTQGDAISQGFPATATGFQADNLMANRLSTSFATVNAISAYNKATGAAFALGTNRWGLRFKVARDW